MFNLDAVTNESNKDFNENGHIFQIIHIEC